MKQIKYIIVALFLVVSLFKRINAEEGTLTVTTDPSGIEVWLGDKYIGDSPVLERKLQTGRYTLKLIDPVQQVSVFDEILIEAGKTTVIEKTLSAKFGTLKVESEPKDAEVIISTSLGKTPLENNFMTPGRYKIEIKHPKKQYIPVVEEITIPAGKKVEITNTLAKKNLLDTKDAVRLILGAGAIGGFVWAIVEQGNHKRFEEQERFKKSDSAAVRRTFGIIIGSACVVGFEIVAFF